MTHPQLILKILTDLGRPAAIKEVKEIALSKYKTDIKACGTTMADMEFSRSKSPISRENRMLVAVGRGIYDLKVRQNQLTKNLKESSLH